MPKLWDAYDQIRGAQAPPAMFAHLTVPLHRISPTAKLHASYRCGCRNRPLGLRPVDLPLTDISRRRLAKCVPDAAPAPAADLLEAAAPIVALVVLSAALTQQLAGSGRGDLSDTALLRSALNRADAARADIVTQLTAHGASRQAHDAARGWCVTAIETGAAVLARIDHTSPADPDRVLREAAAITAPTLEFVYRNNRHPALTEKHRLLGKLATAGQQLLSDGLATGTDPATVRSVIRALIANTRPSEVTQIPDVAVPAGTPLQQAVTDAWRHAARTELDTLLDAVFAEVDAAVTDTVPVLLITDGTPIGKAVGLLAGYPTQSLADGQRVYLVPSVVGRAVKDLGSWGDVVAPLPAGAATGCDEDTARDVFDSVYLRTLCELREHMDSDDAVTAALGVAQPACR